MGKLLSYTCWFLRILLFNNQMAVAQYYRGGIDSSYVDLDGDGEDELVTVDRLRPMIKGYFRDGCIWHIGCLPDQDWSDMVYQPYYYSSSIGREPDSAIYSKDHSGRRKW